MKDLKLDKMEREIEDNAENFVKILAEKQCKIKKIISKAKEKIRITLRLDNQTLALIKQKAQEEGLPYQTLISSILHKYATDRLIDEKDILKSIHMLNK
ncbi:MAG: BrnA antitoxin family protein [Deltaproteobacteria bacterium]|nr:BrnA antitoxin family protein [Deltaproteobacteria bacterium]